MCVTHHIRGSFRAGYLSRTVSVSIEKLSLSGEAWTLQQLKFILFYLLIMHVVDPECLCFTMTMKLILSEHVYLL